MFLFVFVGRRREGSAGPGSRVSVRIPGPGLGGGFSEGCESC